MRITICIVPRKIVLSNPNATIEGKEEKGTSLSSIFESSQVYPSSFSSPFPCSGAGTDRKQEIGEEEEKIGLSGLLDRQC